MPGTESPFTVIAAVITQHYYYDDDDYCSGSFLKGLLFK